MFEHEEKTRKSPKRLIIDIPEVLHAEIKSKAAKNDISIRTWVLKAVIRYLREEKSNEEQEIL